MKNILILCFLAISTIAPAQNNKSLVFFKNGEKQLSIQVQQVDSIVFDNNTSGPEPPEPSGDAVDLGLSVLWATRNVGAEKPQDYGYYLSWGELTPKETYTNETYEYAYVETLNYIDIYGTQYDAAHVLWGDNWRMPTSAECEELVQNCTWEWCSLEDTNGIKVTGPSGKSIFLPAGGFPNWSGWNRVGEYGTYWTGSNTSETIIACYFCFDSGSFQVTSWDGAKYVGQLVRPVRPK